MRLITLRLPALVIQEIANVLRDVELRGEFGQTQIQAELEEILLAAAARNGRMIQIRPDALPVVFGLLKDIGAGLDQHDTDPEAYRLRTAWSAARFRVYAAMEREGYV